MDPEKASSNMDEQKSIINCRVCLRLDQKEANKCLSIFEIYNGCSISEKVNSIANVKITEGDGLPDRICPECLLQLENAVAFKQKCEKSHKILQCNILLANQLTTQSQNNESNKNVSIKKEFVEVDEEYYDNNEYLDTLENDDDFPEGATDEIKPFKSKATDLKLICDDCKENFKSKCKLRVHWKKVHQPEKLICPNCKRMFKSFKAFNLHKKKPTRSCKVATKVRIEGQGKSRIFHCKECTYKSKRLIDMDSHTAIHTGDKRFECKECSKCFTQFTSLQAHRENVHKEYKIDTTCHLCGKRLQGRTKFYRHMKSHKDDKEKCKVCGKSFKNKKYLSFHMARHSGVKSYSCEICAARFYTYCEVYNHKTKVHNKTLSFKCDQCDYMMHSKASLKVHRARHTGTNIVCMVCGQFSENEEKLAIHQKRHIDRNVQCPHCDKKYHNRRSLSKHMCKHHRIRMLVEKRAEPKSDVPRTTPVIKQESPPRKKDEIVILLSPPSMLLK